MTALINSILATTLLIGGAIGISTYTQDHNQNMNTLESKQFAGITNAKEIALKNPTETIRPDNTNNLLNEKQSYHINKTVAQSTSTKPFITEKEAIAIAKKQVNGEVIEVELDEDDNRYEYEIEIRTKKAEAEITIDATTGKVLEIDLDDDNDDN
ncbi:PepSY domain-containing protein [Psychrobacillus sp. NPDC096426]|uniref:PepSY domain-containing protein n=1 Tax=Psychrobacillus sp. NPDC096426 TaxID=3364491 RepID=UPI003800783D